jgi:quinol monooxygenase YgiN
MIQVVASIEVKDDSWPDFLEIFRGNIPNVLAEKGCHQYDGTVDHPMDLPPQDLCECRLTVIECWESEQHLRDHLVAPHMATYREKVKDMVKGVSLRVLKPIT